MHRLVHRLRRFHRLKKVVNSAECARRTGLDQVLSSNVSLECDEGYEGNSPQLERLDKINRDGM